MSAILSTRTMVARLERLTAGATADQLAQADWYADVMARDVTAMAGRHELPFHVVAAVMALLSPGPKYAENVQDTDALLESFVTRQPLERKLRTYGANVTKARALLLREEIDGEWPTICPWSSPLLGGKSPKVRSFFANAMGDWSSVTLDRHAIRPLSADGSDTPKGKEERQRMEDAYRKAAARAGMAPAQYQAVVWCIVRGAAE